MKKKTFARIAKNELPKQRRHKKKRANQKLDPLSAMVGDYAGTLAVTVALQGCTLVEKLAVAALMPSIVKIIRTIPKSKVEEYLEKLYPPAEGVPEA